MHVTIATNRPVDVDLFPMADPVGTAQLELTIPGQGHLSLHASLDQLEAMAAKITEAVRTSRKATVIMEPADRALATV